MTAAVAQDATTSAAPEASATRRIARGAIALFSTQPLTWAASVATAILVPRYLGDAGLGEWGVAWSIAALAANIAALGMQTFLTRKVALDPAHAAAHAWGGIAISTLCSITLSVFVMVSVTMSSEAELPPAVVAVALLGGLLSTIQALFQAVLVGLGRNGRYAISLAGTQILIAALGVTVLMLGGDVFAYACAACVGWAISTAAVVATSGLPFTRDALTGRHLWMLARGGFPFLGWNVALRIRGGVDVILTGILLQPNVAGWLVAAYRVINVPVFIPTIVTTPLLPVLARSAEDRPLFRRLLSGSLETVLFLTVPISAGIFAMAPVIPGVLEWSDSLQNTIPVIMVLAFQQPLVATDMVLGVSLIALGLERPWVRYMVAAAVFNPIANFFVIPFAQDAIGNGAVGAAAVEIVTELLLFIAALHLTPRGLLGRDVLARCLRVLAAGAVLIVVTRLLLPYGTVAAVLGGGTTYLVVAVALGVVRIEQLREVRRALRPA